MPSSVAINACNAFTRASTQQFAQLFTEHYPELAEKNPKELELRKREKKLKELEEQKAEERKLQEAQEFQAEQQKWVKHYDAEFTKAFKDSGLPPKPHLVKRAAELLLLKMDDPDLEDTTVDDIMGVIREEYDEERWNDLREMDPELLVQKLGEETLNRVRKTDLSRVKKPIRGQTTEKVEADTAPKQKWKNADEYLQYLERVRAGEFD